MTTEASDLMDNLLHCAICTQPYGEFGHKPKALPCLHTCCLACLTKHVSVSKTSNRFPCPFCRKVTTMPATGGVDKFPDNFYLRQMADYRHARPPSPQNSAPSPPNSAPCDVCSTGDRPDVRGNHAVKICLDCSIRLCQNCADRHNTLPVTKDHSLRQLDSKEIPCKEHPNSTYKYYCQAHTQCLCITCYQLTHSDCTVQTIIEAASEKMNYLKQLENQCEANRKMLQEQLDISCMHVADLEHQLQEALNTKHALEFSLKQFTPSSLSKEDAEGTEKHIHLLDNFARLDAKLGRLSEVQCCEDLTKFVVHKGQFARDLAGPTDILVLANNSTVAAEIAEKSVKIYNKDGYFDKNASSPHCSPDSIRSQLTAKNENFIRAYSMYKKVYLDTWTSEGALSSHLQLRGDSDILSNISPSGLATAPDGTVLIGDTLGKIHKFSKNGQFIQTIHTTERSDTDILHQNYIVINSLGDIFFSDIQESCIKVYNLDGTLLRTIGSRGSKLGELDEPKALCLWKGNIIVADHKNDRVCMFAQDGKVLTVLVTSVTRPTSVAIRNETELVICSKHSENSYELLVYDLQLVV